MKRFYKLLFGLFFTLIMLHCFLPEKPYIHESKIHGDGLFAGKNYKKGDIIYKDLFPYKGKDDILFNPVGWEKFNRYILKEGRYINHCLRNKNVNIISKDYKSFPLIASRDIQKHEELFGNYDEINKKFPFIAPSLPNYAKC
ncbi:MAG: hypothetical protein CMG46_02935 [Candidatus Marinimicrobia bacterium]|nr:hypothetical protein [Candidatus Neomarinimicrobiota bacterium]